MNIGYSVLVVYIVRKNNIEFSPQQIEAFLRDGYIVIGGLAAGLLTDEALNQMQSLARLQLREAEQPLELEAQLGYPGAPESLSNQGGNTVRRLLKACQRHELWRKWATNAHLSHLLRQLFTEQNIVLSQSHHNCLMTKSPNYSSDTGWHQDIRYWSFQAPELISVWLALGAEHSDNGGLVVIPGSHLENFSSDQFDEDTFFRADIDSNRPFIERAKHLQLNPGDVLFFHCRLLHRASRNYSQDTKYSLVFTYRRDSNMAIKGSRSDNPLDLPLPH